MAEGTDVVSSKNIKKAYKILYLLALNVYCSVLNFPCYIIYVYMRMSFLNVRELKLNLRATKKKL